MSKRGFEEEPDDHSDEQADVGSQSFRDVRRASDDSGGDSGPRTVMTDGPGYHLSVEDRKRLHKQELYEQLENNPGDHYNVRESPG